LKQNTSFHRHFSNPIT